MNKVKIGNIAWATRKKFEEANMKSKVFDPHLGGACSMASIILFDELERAGFKPQIGTGYGHTYVICEGWLVDITATQFGLPRVNVRDYARVQQDIKRKIYHMRWWENHGVYSSFKDAGIEGLREEAMEFIGSAK